MESSGEAASLRQIQGSTQTGPALIRFESPYIPCDRDTSRYTHEQPFRDVEREPVNEHPMPRLVWLSKETDEVAGRSQGLHGRGCLNALLHDACGRVAMEPGCDGFEQPLNGAEELPVWLYEV
jgi:hypothetical protein